MAINVITLAHYPDGVTHFQQDHSNIHDSHVCQEKQLP